MNGIQIKAKNTNTYTKPIYACFVCILIIWKCVFRLFWKLQTIRAFGIHKKKIKQQQQYLPFKSMILFFFLTFFLYSLVSSSLQRRQRNGDFLHFEICWNLSFIANANEIIFVLYANRQPSHKIPLPIWKKRKKKTIFFLYRSP